MSVMATKTIACDDNHGFDEMVKEFLEKKEDLVLHEHTKFGITQEIFRGNTITMYSVIFYGELG